MIRTGGYTVVATKSVAELLDQAFVSCFGCMFTYWIFWVMLVMMVVTIVLQIRSLQEALQHFDSTVVIPANYVSFTIGTITTSGVIFDDFACMSAIDVVFFCIGCLLTFVGVYFITVGRKALKKSSTQLGIDHENDSANASADLVNEGVPLMGEGNAGNVDDQGAGNDGVNNKTPLEPETSMVYLTHKLRDVTERTVDTIVTGIRYQRDVLALPLEQVVLNYRAERQHQSMSEQSKVNNAAENDNNEVFSLQEYGSSARPWHLVRAHNGKDT